MAGTNDQTFTVGQLNSTARIGFDTNGATGNHGVKIVPPNLTNDVVLTTPAASGTLATRADVATLATFADATARSLAVPAVAGQLGLQSDNGSVWRATATTAGAWTHVSGNYVAVSGTVNATAADSGTTYFLNVDDGLLNLPAATANLEFLLIGGGGLDSGAAVDPHTTDYFFKPDASSAGAGKKLIFSNAAAIRYRCVIAGVWQSMGESNFATIAYEA